MEVKQNNIKKEYVRNLSVALIFKVFLLVGAILVRRFLIQFAGNEVNGLNSLYLSIIGFLDVAELGIGSAISFCMYKPIVEGDNDKVSALYCLFKKAYFIIGAIVLVGGLVVMPFLPTLAKEYESANVDLYLTYGLMLASVVLTYTFSARTSLINAYKNNHITTAINSSGLLLQYVSQIVVIVLTKSYVLYLVCRIVASAVQWLATYLLSNKKHKDIIVNKQKVDKQTLGEVGKNIKAMFMHKIGHVIIRESGNIIISAFLGVVVLGFYSNYTTIMMAMWGMLILFFTPLTSIIGHLYVQADKNEVKSYYNFFFGLNFIIGAIFFLGYYGVIDNVITMFFGAGLEMEKTVSFAITLNYFIMFLRQSTLLFRDSTGTFYNDRWKTLIEGIVNVILSIIFVNLFGVTGVVWSTILTNMLICHVVEPYVLFKHAFKCSVKKQYLTCYLYILMFVVALVGLHFAMVDLQDNLLQLLINGCIAVAFAIAISLVVVFTNKDFRTYFKIMYLKKGKKEKVEQSTDAQINDTQEEQTAVFQTQEDND